MSTPRAAIYARQSSPEEDGIAQQIHDCRAEALRLGWPVVLEPFFDDDTSGSVDRGPKTDWAKMLKAFDAGEFDALIVNETSRVTRRLFDVLELRPPKRNIRIFVVRGGIDTGNSFGDYMFKQFVLTAEHEVKQKTIRDQRYAVERRKKGHPTAGRTPHGYRWVHAPDRDDEGIRYAIDEDEARNVRRIFEEFLAGASMKQIAKDLNEDGRRTRRDTRWGASTVRRILMNPVYAGLLPPAQPTGQFGLENIVLEECGTGAWEPIIDQDRFMAARGRLVGVKPNHEGTARKWLLPGLAVCGRCRGPIRSAKGETQPTPWADGSGRAPQKRYHAYRCVDGGHFMRNGDIIDDYVCEVIIERLSKEDAVELLRPPEDLPDPAVLYSLKTELEGRDAAITSLLARGKISADGAEEALDELAAEIRRVNDQIGRIHNQDPLAEVVDSDDVRQWWKAATLARRRTVVGELMTVVIYPVGKGKRVTTIAAAAGTVGIEWRREAGTAD